MVIELEALGDLSLFIILTKLGPKDSAVIACTSRKLRSSASEESLWKTFCYQDLDLSDPIDHFGNPISSFKETYQVWRKAFGMYPWPLVKRVKRCWDRLKNWLSNNFPEALATLQKGASESEIQELENSLKVKLPLPTRILYRFHDGQELKGKYHESIRGCPLGIIGGYSFYDRSVNVYLLPLSRVISETKSIIRSVRCVRRLKYIVVASSSTMTEKVIFFDCIFGRLLVGTALLDAGETMPCVPDALINSVHDYDAEGQQDALLLWLEEHARRLENGIIKLRENRGTRSISLFPDEPPLLTVAVTNGVRVGASAVLIPEYSQLRCGDPHYQFTYLIRMSLQAEGCIINGMTFSSCQLHFRHWTVRADDNVIAEINGEGVIGKFPLLHPGKEEFVYESLSAINSKLGSMEGSFTFVPGSLTQPKGSPFEVQVASFPLQLPDYIF